MGMMRFVRGLLASLVRCPVCRSARSDAAGCCRRCLTEALRPLRFGDRLALGPYDGATREAVRALKFRDVTALARTLGRQLGREARHAGWPIDGVCAVPLHGRRGRERGYNQAALLARAAADELGVAFLEPLERVRATRQQARLDGTQRRRNVAGAFRSVPVRGRILLIDDVRTSGATLEECARELKRAGAGGVFVAVVAEARVPRADGVSGLGRSVVGRRGEVPAAGSTAGRDGVRDGVRDGARDGARDGGRDGVRDGARDNGRDGGRVVGRDE